jgi:hypothetical protein
LQLLILREAWLKVKAKTDCLFWWVTAQENFTTMKGSPFNAGKIPNRIAIGDVNGDGVNDIVTSDNDSDKIYLFL